MKMHGPLASPVLNGSSILSVGCPLHSAVSIFNYFAYLNWLDGACPSVHVCLVRGGGRGGYGGGDRRRDNYRDNAGSGPDRHHHGGNRSRPY
ncbi:hypothetical protein CK203_073989 [Vitis vinifera]|uniref:Uncharacterized protein n=1 Tax=Vitis vinifera TaxID=29760 RepID=A0A438DQ10_VITVI|nr:hypothetical protein CK203_073989 [Vitis vinifera]